MEDVTMDTNGYIERTIIHTLAAPKEFVPVGPGEDPDAITPKRYGTDLATTADVLDALRGRTDSLVRSRTVSVRRAFLRLAEKGLVERAGTDADGRQQWRLTETGREEAVAIHETYLAERAEIEKRYGGEWMIF